MKRVHFLVNNLMNMRCGYLAQSAAHRDPKRKRGIEVLDFMRLFFLAYASGHE
jgi:hypothetical protein